MPQTFSVLPQELFEGQELQFDMESPLKIIVVLPKNNDTHSMTILLLVRMIVNEWVFFIVLMGEKPVPNSREEVGGLVHGSHHPKVAFIVSNELCHEVAGACVLVVFCQC